MSESGIAKLERVANDVIERDGTGEQSRREQIEMMAEKLTIKRSDIVRELEAIVHARLFGPGPWLIDREAGAALEKRILQMGLRDEAQGQQATGRGAELIFVCMKCLWGCGMREKFRAFCAIMDS
jgi:hypothetical protein